MTHHLTSQEFVEAVEGTLSASRQSHVANCAACAAEVRSLSDLLAEVGPGDGGADVPEPSPLFWDHFQRRVSDAVEAESHSRHRPVVSRSSGRDLWSLAGSWRAVVGVMAVVALMVAAASYSGRLWPASAGTPTEADAAAINNMAAGSAIDGPEWDFVTSVLETLDPDEMQHVLAPTARGVDAAFENLNAQEREKFLELLQTEMTAGLE